MFKNLVTTLYKVMYNKRIKQSNDPKIFGCLTSSLFLFAFFLNIITTYEIISRTRVVIYYGKISSFIIFGTFSFFMYLLLFRVFNVDQDDIGTSGYEIEKTTTRKVWMIYIINTSLLFILPLLRKFIFKV
ncbi:hypothetical protein HDF25_002216 [Pedobacter cryoconitis]|uniref:Uncharacterized protein n=1 Tax=Pedobacter cryoconitis TaxID=188932 RepID=A0A7X0MI73_9SPHI|nr:hypothetical protein [Pedobacter cryoconitis]